MLFSTILLRSFTLLKRIISIFRKLFFGVTIGSNYVRTVTHDIYTSLSMRCDRTRTPLHMPEVDKACTPSHATNHFWLFCNKADFSEQNHIFFAENFTSWKPKHLYNGILPNVMISVQNILLENSKVVNGPIMLQWSHSVNFTVKFVLAEIKTFFFWGYEAVDLWAKIF